MAFAGLRYFLLIKARIECQSTVLPIGLRNVFIILIYKLLIVIVSHENKLIYCAKVYFI